MSFAETWWKHNKRKRKWSDREQKYLNLIDTFHTWFAKISSVFHQKLSFPWFDKYFWWISKTIWGGEGRQRNLCRFDLCLFPKKTLLDKIKEMLWFVEKVLGYKVKKSQNNYFLYSEFSEVAEDGFHFCMTKPGENNLPNFELQVNETYENLPERLTEQLQRQKCLPSFFASWQLDLYSQMTTLN